jgi:hypothetical protein
MEQVAPVQADDEAQALEAAKAGYAGKTRAQAPAEPAAVVQTPVAQPLANSTSTAPDEDADAETNPPAEPTKPTDAQTVARQLEDLKAQVREMKESGADAATVRKMHGEIGSINGALQQLLAATKAETPEKVDELAAALARAKKTAEEYPEIAGPMVDAIEIMQARMAQQQAPQVPEKKEPERPQVAAPPSHPSGFTPEQVAAIRALDEVHPDRHEINKSPEFQAWLKAKPTEYQTKAKSSWNPAVVAQPYSDFKAFKAAQKRKQDRLDAAVTPQGTPQQAQPTTLPDEAGLERGYARARRQRL